MSLATSAKRLFLGPGQTALFFLVVASAVVFGDRFEWEWHQRWTVGSLAGLLLSCIVYYLIIDSKGFAFIFGGLFATVLLTLRATINSPQYHLIMAQAVAVLLVFADLGRVAEDGNINRFERWVRNLFRIKPPTPEERRADPSADKAVRILHYVDYPQVIGLSVILGCFFVARGSFDVATADNFLAGAFAFQIVASSSALAFIDMDMGRLERSRADAGSGGDGE